MQNKNDIRIAKTYAALISSYEELIKQKPFTSVTVAELCRSAMVSRQSFYSHFDDAHEFGKFYLRHLRDEIHLRYGDTLEDFYADVTDAFAFASKFLTDNPEIIEAGLTEDNLKTFFDDLSELIVDECVRYINRLIDLGVVEPMNTELVMNYLAKGVVTVIGDTFKPGQEVDLVSMIDQTRDLTLAISNTLVVEKK